MLTKASFIHFSSSLFFSYHDHGLYPIIPVSPLHDASCERMEDRLVGWLIVTGSLVLLLLLLITITTNYHPCFLSIILHFANTCFDEGRGGESD